MRSGGGVGNTFGPDASAGLHRVNEVAPKFEIQRVMGKFVGVAPFTLGKFFYVSQPWFWMHCELTQGAGNFPEISSKSWLNLRAFYRIYAG